MPDNIITHGAYFSLRALVSAWISLTPAEVLMERDARLLILSYCTYYNPAVQTVVKYVTNGNEVATVQTLIFTIPLGNLDCIIAYHNLLFIHIHAPYFPGVLDHQRII